MITPSFALTATERVLPKLALDFTTASLDPRVTFTRSGATATVVNSSGVIQGVAADTPRFDYNPTTLVCKGLLIEEARTNLSLYSEQLNQVSWTLSGATVSADAINSPDGTLNADKLQEDSTTGAHRINQAYVKAASAITYTMSMYVKPAERSQLQIRLRATSIGNNGTAIFDVSTGVVNSVTASGTYSNASATISLQNNGWYRCTLTVTTDTGVAVSLNANLYNGSDSYTGVTGNGLYIWGAQLEAAAFATSYIPTTLAQVTRSADLATMTGTNFSAWFTGGAAAGTFQTNFIYPNAKASGGQRYLGFNGFLGFQDTGGFLAFFDGTGTRVLGTMVASNTVKKYAIGYSGVTSSAGKNGALATAAYSNAAFNPTTLYFGRSQSTTAGELNGWIQQVYYWPQRLTNAELQAFSK
jgi:hypothetical protein